MMQKSLYELNFEIRFACRVLERQARFWRKLDIAIKMLSLLSGSAAFAALTNGNSRLTLALGIVFAVSQAIEFSVQPGSKAAEAKYSIKPYSRLLSDGELVKDASALALALCKVRDEDSVTAFDSINRLAYADVALEMGRPEYIDLPSRWVNAMRLMA